jgi:hypothetical protein
LDIQSLGLAREVYLAAAVARRVCGVATGARCGCGSDEQEKPDMNSIHVG